MFAKVMRLKKKKQTRRSLSFFKLHARAFPPYKVLVDGSFAAAVASKKLGAVEDVCARVLEAGVRIFVTSCVMRELRRLQAEQRRCGDGNGVVGDHAVDYAQLVSACSREHCLKCEYVTEEEVAAAAAAAAVAAEQTQKKEDEQVVHESDVGEDEDEDEDADDVKDNGNAAATTDDEDEEGEEGEDEATREERRRERQRRRKREERRRRQLRAKQEYVTGAACILKRVEAAVAASYPEYNDKPSQTNENYAGVCRGGSADAARECLFVATQDARLKPLLRRLPGVPIITVTPSGRVILEPPSPKQLAMAEEGEAGRRKVADHEGARIAHPHAHIHSFTR